MALKDIFKMTKANRYTADGREELIKAQEAETEDRRYNIGEISEKTGLQKTANGWVKPKGGAERNHGIEQKKRGPGAIHTPGKGNVGMDKMKEAAEKGLKGQELKEFMTGSKSESKPDESARIAASKEARAKKSQELGQKAAGDFAKYKDLPPVQRKDALGAASHEGISIGMTQRSMEGMGWDLIQADDKVNVYGKPDGSKAIMKHDGKKITEVNYEGPGSKTAIENKTTIRQGPNTKTLNETPAEHVQKNLDAYKGYQPGDMEELVLKPSGYKKQTSARVPGGGQSITYTKNGAEDITLFFDKHGELENADVAGSKPDSADLHDQIGGEIKGNLEAAKYYFKQAQNFSPTDPSYKTYMTKAKQYNDKAKAQADDYGFDFEEMHNSGITQSVNTYAQENQDSAPRILTGDTRIRVRK